MNIPGDRHDVAITLNGLACSGSCEARTTLVDFVRDELHATGTHVGCEHGVCGACTVLLDGEPVRSCLLFAVQASGRSVETMEGLGPPDDLHPVPRAFLEAMSFQCGYCTPGIVMTTIAFLSERESTDAPSDTEIREMLSGNLCRCTGYQSIVDGVRLAATVFPPI